MLCSNALFLSVKHDDKTLENYLDNYRTNPDGMDLYYVFKNKIWLACVYKQKTKKRMDLVYYYAVPVKKVNNDFVLDESRDIQNITSNKDFTSFFENIYGNYYHPNELAAEALAKYITFDMNLNSSKTYSKLSPYVKNMEIWIKTEL